MDEKNKGRGTTRLNSVRNLDVYKTAFETAMEIFEISKGFPTDEKYSLTDQIRRSSRSICSNLAEAWRKRKYKAVFVNKLTDAGQEAAESQTWLEFAYACNYIKKQEFDRLFERYEHIFAMLVHMERKADSFCAPCSSVVSRPSSFSLIELVTVLGLFALAAAIVIPALMFWMRARELPDAVKTIQSAIDIVRMQCIAQGNAYGVSFQASDSGVDQFQLVGLYTIEDANDNVLAPARNLPSSVTFQMPLPGAGLDNTKNEVGIEGEHAGFITFKTSGEVESRYLNDPNVDPKIVLVGRNSKTKTLVINRITGKVTVS